MFSASTLNAASTSPLRIRSTGIGSNCQCVTIAKGPLTTSTTNKASGVDFPAHALIIPLEHAPTLALIADEDNRSKTFTEMSRFKTAIQSMIAHKSSDKLGCVSYEISRGNGVHTHWQLLPMPVDLIRRGLVEAAFKVEAENMSYPEFRVRDPGIGLEDGDFFRVWLWAPSLPASDDGRDEEGAPLKSAMAKTITMFFDDSVRFDLQFGRKVLAKLLGLEGRIQWRDCAQTEDEEKTDVEAFKIAFKKFDFSLE